MFVLFDLFRFGLEIFFNVGFLNVILFEEFLFLLSFLVIWRKAGFLKNTLDFKFVFEFLVFFFIDFKEDILYCIFVFCFLVLFFLGIFFKIGLFGVFFNLFFFGSCGIGNLIL